MTDTLEADLDIDLWAVRVVVREGKFMQLGLREMTLACHLMERKGLEIGRMADILRTNSRRIDRHLASKPFMTVDEALKIDPAIVGPPYPKHLISGRSLSAKPR